MIKLWWIRNDPCGMFSAALTVGLVLFAHYVIVKLILLPWAGFSHHIIWFSAICILSLISHTRAQFTDPGAIPETFVPPPLPQSDLLDRSPYPCPAGPKICRACRTIKSPQAYHCGTCKRCLIRMDHHCPWVNNCVAIHNQKYFILFLVYTAASCFYAAAVLASRFFSCSSFPRQCTVTGWATALGIVTFVEALIFGLFVIIMMFDQFTAIFEGNQDEMQHYKQQLSSYEYNIEHKIPVYGPKPEKPLARTKYESLCLVFGESFSYRWFLPLNMPASIQEAFEAELRVGQKNANNAIDHINRHIELVGTLVQKQMQATKSSEAAAAQRYSFENMLDGGAGEHEEHYEGDFGSVDDSPYQASYSEQDDHDHNLEEKDDIDSPNHLDSDSEEEPVEPEFRNRFLKNQA